MDKMSSTVFPCIGQVSIPFLGSVLGSGPKDPALSALIPPRPLAPSEPPAALLVLLDDCGCPAAVVLTAGEGGGGLSDAPAEGKTGVAAAAAPPTAAAPAAEAAPAAAPARYPAVSEQLLACSFTPLHHQLMSSHASTGAVEAVQVLQ